MKKTRFQMRLKYWFSLMMLAVFCFPGGGTAQDGMHRHVKTMSAEDEMLQALFPTYHRETQTIDHPGSTEYLIIRDIQPWTCFDQSLIVALVVTSGDRNAHMYSFLDTSPPEERVGTMSIFVLQEQDGRLTCLAKQMTEMGFADETGYKANEVLLDLGPYEMTETDCAFGVKIVSTPTVAKGQEILTLYSMHTGELHHIFDAIIGFSDRVNHYESTLRMSQTTTNGHFDIIQRMYVEPIVSDDGEERRRIDHETRYTWNSARQYYEASSSEEYVQ